ncbi:MAG: hypothetical protein IPL55_09945 [Saprospiraceae bacterium]|nr:hypothetical protein [Saprospiraceae bacterium]
MLYAYGAGFVKIITIFIYPGQIKQAVTSLVKLLEISVRLIKDQFKKPVNGKADFKRLLFVVTWTSLFVCLVVGAQMIFVGGIFTYSPVP